MINLENLWNKIHSYAQQYKREYLSLLKNIFTPLNPDIIVELGTHAGGSFWGFCEASSNDSILISIDNNHAGDSKRIRNFHKNAFTITGNTQDEKSLIETKKIINGREIDFLFIDADHTYDGVKNDFEIYSQLVRDHGVIAFHDVYHIHNKGCDVDKFWNEIKNQLKWKSDEYHEPNRINYGIGVIQKNNFSDRFVF